MGLTRPLMACYHPMKAEPNGFGANGNVIYKITGEYLGIKDYKDIIVPCGRCIGCRLDYSREWADRMILELDYSKTALFLTLTYDDISVPRSDLGFMTLNTKHMDNFVRRLRRRFSEKEIRYFYSGEYGDTTFRPHYHGIFFGLELDDIEDLVFYKNNRDGDSLYTSVLLSELWSFGYVVVGRVTWHSCAYTARYVLKKLTGDWSKLYEEKGIIPPYSRSSRRPGIGGHFIEDYPELIGKSISVSDPDIRRKIKRVKTPSYLLKKLDAINPELYNRIKSERLRLARDSDFLELQQTDHMYGDYLTVKENYALSSMRSFRSKI